MICEKCGKNIATTHIETYINGQESAMDLCSSCAAEMNAESQFQMGLGGLLGSIFGDSAVKQQMGAGKRCSFCGRTFDQIAGTGRVGCAGCYSEFFDRLVPTLNKLHGNTTHTGKIPGSAKIDVSADAVEQSEEERLRAELADAVAAEKFEKAAEIRDRLNELKGGN